MGKQPVLAQPEKEVVPVKLLPDTDLFNCAWECATALDKLERAVFLKDPGRENGHEFEGWFRGEAESLRLVHLDLVESDDGFTVHAEVPGFSAKEIEVSMGPRRLTVCGKHETSEERTSKKMIQKEQCSNEIYRAIELPVDVDTSNVTATLKEGVLEVLMPKGAKRMIADFPGPNPNAKR
jgi:HSP20 family molecular chaperone IbpA